MNKIIPLSAGEAGEIPPAKILIVDDMSVNILLLTRILSIIPAEISSAKSGIEALNLCQQSHFALILLDVHMPNMDGYEVAKHLQSTPRTQHIPIIFISAIYNDDEHRFTGYAAGAVDYISKPFDRKMLLQKVKVFLDLFLQKQKLRHALNALEESHQLLEAEIEERQLIQSELYKLSEVVQQNPSAIVITDTQLNIEFVNCKFEQLSGYSLDEIKGHNYQNLRQYQTPEPRLNALKQAIKQAKLWQGDVCYFTKDRQPYWVQLTISPILDHNKQLNYYLFTQEDISLRLEYEKRLLDQTYFHKLTHLPNRLMTAEQLGQLLEKVKGDDAKIIILYIDIDNFKRINDSLGFEYGENALLQIAQRLKNNIRDESLLAHFERDEFAVICLERAPNQAESLANQLLHALRSPFYLDDKELLLHASIGVATAPEKQLKPHDYLQNAEAAMYKAKDAGGDTYRFFTEGINKQAVQRLSIEAQLSRALENNELSLYYQPQLDLKTARMTKAEALLRWHNPLLGQVSPESFIPLAERSGLINPIGEWVLDRALKDVKKWRDQFHIPLKVAINISPVQCNRERNLFQSLQCILNKSQYSGDMLEIEITERLLMDTGEATLRKLQQAQEMGIEIAIDDFGTGYSSLSYLKRFPISTVKIDKSFICDIGIDKEDDILVQGIIALSHGLNMQVVAEGVETIEQYQFLQDQNCDLIQGYYFSKALSATDFSQFIRQQLNKASL